MIASNSLKILNWNVAWRSADSKPGAEILSRIESIEPDVVCLTESKKSFGLEGFEGADANPDYGYPLVDGRRKVRLLSRTPLTDVDTVGDAEMPTGRFVAANVNLPNGGIRIIAVCIPWSHAHVSTGGRDRKIWEEHTSYLRGLARTLQTVKGAAILLGDFNQRVPRRNTPKHVYDELLSTLGSRFTIVTSGPIRGAPTLAIDHVAITKELEMKDVYGISNISENGLRLSDHFGIVVNLRLR